MRLPKFLIRSRIGVMSKPKLAFSIILMMFAVYFAFKYTDAPRILAQVNPEFSQQVSAKYNEFLRFNANLKSQSGDSYKFLSNLTTLNTQELVKLEDSYKTVAIDVNVDLNSLPEAQAVKTLKLSVIRYENLNQALYRVFDQLKAAGTAINESGFATSNIDQEITSLTETITKIEAHIATINYISDQISEKKVALEDGIKNASDLISDVNTEYNDLFKKV